MDIKDTQNITTYMCILYKQLVQKLVSANLKISKYRLFKLQAIRFSNPIFRTDSLHFTSDDIELCRHDITL